VAGKLATPRFTTSGFRASRCAQRLVVRGVLLQVGSWGRHGRVCHSYPRRAAGALDTGRSSGSDISRMARLLYTSHNSGGHPAASPEIGATSCLELWVSDSDTLGRAYQKACAATKGPEAGTGRGGVFFSEGASLEAAVAFSLANSSTACPRQQHTKHRGKLRTNNTRVSTTTSRSFF
jgi:hypothetical protein